MSIAMSAISSATLSIAIHVHHHVSHHANLHAPGLSTSMSITILALLSATLVRGASEVDGYALGGDFKRKVAKSGEPCRQQGISFIPLAADTLGGWHSVAIEQIQKLGRALARQSGEDEDKTIRHLFQKLSLLLMRGNSALLLNRVPVVDIDPEAGGWE